MKILVFVSRVMKVKAGGLISKNLELRMCVANVRCAARDAERRTENVRCAAQDAEPRTENVRCECLECLAACECLDAERRTERREARRRTKNARASSSPYSHLLGILFCRG